MTTALYRRYRPESFAEMIGQSQVTDPLMTALRGDRVGHAYLFSGPRGCGKTTSARILARCLNCAAGPTDTPCGTCDSCVELGRGGGGSLDVVEIDAASHNGVDDARDLRERAVFAPARDRFKIFILDEAHMVTPQGFNALLKLVEEPPDHVKFIFATTEPEKVIGTIRSRTHHYPFRLVPPAAMLEYVQALCAQEGVEVEAGVLPLVVRAGGGSPRDTLSLLDQLIAGSDDGRVAYARAVALLGYTHAELLDEVVEAFGTGDAAAAFGAVDRVVQTGQDPRRFVDDLLERLRDLIIVAAAGTGAHAVLRGVSSDDLERMGRQAGSIGSARLSGMADLVIAALDDMTGATSPRLQLELMVARVLARTAPGADAAPGAATAPVAAPPPAAEPPARIVAEPVQPPTAAASATGAAAASVPVPPPEVVAPPVPSGPVTLARMTEEWARVLTTLEGISRSSWLIATTATPTALDGDVLTLSFRNAADVASFKQRKAGAGPSEDLRRAIQSVLGITVKYLARHDPGSARGGPDDPPPADPAEPELRRPTAPATSVRSASAAAAPVTEWAVATIPSSDGGAAFAGATTTHDAAPSAPVALAVDVDPEDAASELGRVRAGVAAPARDGDVLSARDVEPPASLGDDDSDAEDLDVSTLDAPLPPAIAPPLPVTVTMRNDGVQRYGEAVVRQMLGATFVREEPYEPPTRFS